MISKELFTHHWNLLDGRFGGRRDRQQKDAYYVYLNSAMDDDRFRAAAQIIWANDDRFPKPSRFTEAAPAVGSTSDDLRQKDPYRSTVIQVSRNTRWGADVERQFKRRRQKDIEVSREDRNGFPRPVVEFVN